MRTLDDDEILIPYGVSRPPADVLAVSLGEAGRISVECRAPHVVVSPSRRAPLRLSGGQYDFTDRSGAAANETLERLRDGLARYCDLWRKAQRQFLAAYFDFIAAEVEAGGEELTARLKPFGDLYWPEDWAFAALRPLPQALLSIAPGYDPANLVAVDFAFWTGSRAVAVVLRGSATADPGRAAALDALRGAGVAVVEAPGNTWRAADIAAILPDEFRRFWRDVPVPAGPFGPALPDALGPDA